MKFKGALGVYEGFPNAYHGFARVKFNTSLSELQTTILSTLYKLNGQKINDNLARLIGSNVEVIFEVGVANGLTFNYIDEEELKILFRESREKNFSILDFLCIIRYYALRSGKRRALRFDYYLFRILFVGREFEIRVFHEKGLQRISAKDLIKFLIEKINLELSKRRKGSIEIKYLQAY